MDTKSVKTIFITGATGLVGSHAAQEALKRGHRVRAGAGDGPRGRPGRGRSRAMIRVLLADDQALVRAGFRMLLE